MSEHFVTPLTTAHKALLSSTISCSLLKLTSIELVMPSKHLILCRPLLLLTSILPSIKVFSSELALCIRGPKYWSFSFSISPFKVYSGLISFRIDCSITLLSKGLSRVFSSTIVWKHQFFGAQVSLYSNSHIHTWPLEKPKLWLDRSLSAINVSAFNMLFRFVITFLPRYKCLLISWLQSPSAMILEFPK